MLTSPFRSRSFNLLVVSIVVLIAVTAVEIRDAAVTSGVGAAVFTLSAQIAVVALLLVVAAAYTNRRQLQLLEQHFRSTFEQAPVGICHCDTSGTFVAVNEAFCRMVGYTAAELTGRRYLDISHADDRERTTQLTADVASGRVGSASYDRRYVRKDGETLWVHVTLAGVQRRGKVDHLLAMVEDISTVRRARERLKFQALLLDCVDEAVIATDAAGHVVYWNRFAEELYGWKAAEAIGCPIAEMVVAPAMRQQAEAVMARIRGGEVWSGDFEVISRESRRFFAHVTESPIFDDDGALIGIVGISTDVTEQRRAAELVRNREAQLSLAQQLAWLGSWELDYRTGERLWSEQTFRMYGLEPGDAGTAIETLKSLIVTEDRPKMERAFADVVGGAAAIECEYRVRRANDGAVRLIRSKGWLLRDDDGKPAKMVGILTDLTEARANETELRRYAALQSTVAEIGTYALSALDDATIERVCSLMSKAIDVDYARFMEYRPETNDLTVRAGHAFDTAVVPAIPETQAGYALLTNEAVVVNDFRTDWRFAVTKKLMPTTISANIVVPVRGRSTTFGVLSALSERPRTFTQCDVQFLRSIANILAEAMEREAANRAVVASEARYRALVEGANDIIYTTSPEGLTLSLNPAFERVTGWKASQWIGRPFRELIAERDHERAWSLFSQLLETHDLPPYELALLAADGSEISIEGTAFAHVEDGRVTEVSGFCRDVTQSRRMQAQLEQEKRVASLGRLATTVAHEFNNVLMGISPFVDVLKREVESPRGRLALDHMSNSIRRGKGITSEVLRFARAADPVLAPIEVQPWLRRVTDEARRMVGAKYEVLDDIAPALPPLLGDANQLHQIMTNLILNARDAMPDGGRIVIAARMRSEPPAIVVEVRDDGCGMPPEVLQHIFEPLFTTKNSGTGLGLAVTHQVVSRHGGEIAVDSRVGEGTSFRLTLPVANRHGDEPRRGKTAGAARFKRVLLVEDEPAVAAGLAALLEADGMNVTTVQSGAEVEGAIERDRPDVVILDIGLPDVDGTKVYHDVASRHPRLPVVFSTGHGDRAKLEAHIANPHVGFILKPYSAGALYSEFERLR